MYAKPIKYHILRHVLLMIRRNLRETRAGRLLITPPTPTMYITRYMYIL